MVEPGNCNSPVQRWVLARCCLGLLVLAASALVVAASEDEASVEKPQWELGLGLGSLYVPHYYGSDDAHSYTALFPYGSFRAPRFSAGRDGIRGGFVGGEDWALGLSVSVRLPVDSDDSAARAGMDDLDAQLEIGPNFQWYAAQFDSVWVRLEFPLRAAFSLSSGEFDGLTANPRVVARKIIGNWQLTATAGAVISDRQYHERIYNVAANEATLARPAFQAAGGYTATRLSTSFQYRSRNWIAAAFVSSQHLNDAQNIDSPLLRERDTLSAGIVLTRLFKKSSHTVLMDKRI